MTYVTSFDTKNMLREITLNLSNKDINLVFSQRVDMSVQYMCVCPLRQRQDPRELETSG